MNEIRSTLAKRHGATVCCHIITGIFAWVSADASEKSRGGEGIPYWKAVKAGGGAKR